MPGSCLFENLLYILSQICLLFHTVKINMFLDRCKTFAADHMLDLACITCCNNRINTQLFKPFGKEKMTLVDFFLRWHVLIRSDKGIPSRRYGDLIGLAEASSWQR